MRSRPPAASSWRGDFFRARIETHPPHQHRCALQRHPHPARVDRDHRACRTFTAPVFQYRLVKPQPLAARRRIRAGLRIASAHQVEDLARAPREIDLGVPVAAWRFVGRAGFRPARSLAPPRLDEIDRLDHGLDAQREEAVEVERSDGVFVARSGSLRCKRIGPVSIPLSGQNQVTPACASPMMRVQLIALAPRWRGRSEG